MFGRKKDGKTEKTTETSPKDLKKQKKAEEYERSHPLAHDVKTGESLNYDQLEDSKKDSEGFKKKENLIRRLILVQQDNEFMDLVGNLPIDPAKEKVTNSDELDDLKEGFGEFDEIGNEAMDVTDTVLDIVDKKGTKKIATEIVSNVIGELFKYVKNIENSFKAIVKMVDLIKSGKSAELDREMFFKTIETELSTMSATEGIVSAAGRSIPLVGFVLSMVSDGIGLLKLALNQKTALDERNLTKENIEGNDWDLKDRLNKDRDFRRDETNSRDAYGNKIKDPTEAGITSSWDDLLEHKRDLLKAGNGGPLDKKDEENLHELESRDQTMRKMITFESLRKQDLTVIGGWKGIADGILSFASDLTSFICPVVGAVFNGISLTSAVGGTAIKFFRKHFMNHDKKNEARRIYASYLYNHMHEAKPYVINGKFLQRIGSDMNEAENDVVRLDSELNHEEKINLYGMADDISFTENTLKTNKLDYDKAKRKKTKRGLIQVMADSFSQD